MYASTLGAFVVGGGPRAIHPTIPKYAPTRLFRPRLLGDSGPDALALAAQQILNSVPPGSGTNPITMQLQQDKGFVNTVDTQYGGSRATPYYQVYPVRDPSGLIDWTGADSAQFVDGLTTAQLLAAQVLLNGGDTSFSADFHPTSPLQYQASGNQAIDTVQQNYNAPAPTPTVNNAVLDQSGTPLVNTYPANDPRNFGMTQDELDQYVKTHGGFLPGDARGGTGEVSAPVQAPPITTQTADGVIGEVLKQGGDPTQWTGVVDASTGATVALVRQNPNTGGTELQSGGSASLNVAGVVNKVTGFIDRVAGTLQNAGTEVQKVGNAIQGGAAGAQAGYNLPANAKPWLIGAGVAAALLLVTRGRR